MATILFLDSNSAGNATRAIRWAQEQGFRTHFLARRPEEYGKATRNPLELADLVTEVDTLDIVKLMRLDYGADVQATIAFDELRVVQAALLGEYLGVHFNPPIPGLLNTRFKDRTRRCLRDTAYGLRFSTCTLSDPPKGSPVGYPCVVKPLDEAASIGVRVCAGAEDYLHGVATLRRIVARPNNRGYRLVPSFLVEEYVDGEEFSAEMVWSERLDDWRLIGYCRKHLTGPPLCIETRDLFPHHFGGGVDDEVLRQLRECLYLLGLRRTAVHFEFRLSGQQVRVIDVNPRSAGDRSPDLVEQAIGVDLAALHLAAHLGRADALLDQARPRCYTGVQYLTAPRPGKIAGFRILAQPDHGLLGIYTPPTPLVVDEAVGNNVLTAQVLVHGASQAEVIERLLLHAATVIHQYESTVESPAPPDGSA